jgi:hypothetical protein
METPALLAMAGKRRQMTEGEGINAGSFSGVISTLTTKIQQSRNGNIK